jgi:hypothetical protein
MNEQDEKSFYMGMIILGLIVRGAPFNHIPEMATNLLDQITNQLEESK